MLIDPIFGVSLIELKIICTLSQKNGPGKNGIMFDCGNGMYIALHLCLTHLLPIRIDIVSCENYCTNFISLCGEFPAVSSSVSPSNLTDARYFLVGVTAEVVVPWHKTVPCKASYYICVAFS